jgi:hypothetical protein
MTLNNGISKPSAYPFIENITRSTSSNIATMPPKVSSDSTDVGKHAALLKEVVAQFAEKGFQPDMQRLADTLGLTNIPAARMRWIRFKKELGIETVAKADGGEEGAGGTPTKKASGRKKRIAGIEGEGEDFSAPAVKKPRTPKKKVVRADESKAQEFTDDEAAAERFEDAETYMD